MARTRFGILRLVAAGVLGVATTVAVAWGLACGDVPGRGITSSQEILPSRGPVVWEPLGGPGNGISASVYLAAGRFFVTTQCFGPENYGALGIPGPGPEFVKRPPDEIVPACVRGIALPWLDGYSWPRGRDVDWREVQASGWPLISLATEYRRAANWTHERQFGIPISGTRILGEFWRRGRASPRMLPLRPLWSGFVLDAVLYGAAWLMLLFIPGSIRSRLRRRSGLCRSCAYDLRGIPAGAVCPECGRGP